MVTTEVSGTTEILLVWVLCGPGVSTHRVSIGLFMGIRDKKDEHSWTEWRSELEIW